ncbi:hypothetical protein ACFWIA_05560 [Streptomyces sp. NPDC127068]|uniref:hypothetical protein n=1 Tax=Streptomyces sp. NPDC127068 TaxID=3347127 RepID=UPI00365F437B
MQHPAVPEPAHTRTRPIHWVATAAALAGVIAASSLLQPDAATAVQEGRPRVDARKAPGPAPDPADVKLPLDCGPVGVRVVQEASGDLDGDGTPETVAVARCDTGMGTPPSGVYVLTRAGAEAAPRVIATLVEPKDRLNVTDLTVRGGTVLATLLGYSSSEVPNCCPDERKRTTWTWHEGRFISADTGRALSA